MTSRERIEAALSHREPDRTPMFEYVLLSPVADALLGRIYAGDPARWPALLAEKGWEEAVRQMAVDRLDLACLLGHDMLYVTPNPPVPQPAAAPTALPLPPPDDPVERLHRRNEQNADSAPPPDETLLIYRFLKDEMDRRGLDLPILAPAYVHGVWADTDLMEAMALAPEAARRHFALATKAALGWIEKYIALGIDQIGVGGDFAGNRPLISPRAYREFIAPQVRILSRRIHEAGCRAVNASDGNLWSVLEDFTSGCEADGYLEIDMHAGMDMRRLKASVGDRVTLYGNLDCGTTLSFGSVEYVRRHTLDCLEAGWGNGGHILCASNAITASVPVENYVSVVNAYRGRFGLERW
ncbi:MAG: hypothetical protein IT210_14740 [Armatimonadetes bacterium]|nr:hypothetical protein [Armatimonadota bacterium]